MAVKSKNVHTSMTLNRFLYAALEEEADSRGIKIAHVVNEELSKVLRDKIQLLRQQEKNKYNE